MTNTRCEANTKKHGTQCENYAATWNEFSKQMLCHLHHPASTFRKQVAMKHKPVPLRTKPHVMTLASVRFPNRIGLNLHAEPEDSRTPGLDRPFNISLTAGKADPEPPRKTLFRPAK
jgi:hypothetical protein